MRSIIHIVTHLGGGVGRALSNITIYERRNNPDDQHKIILLDEPQNKFFFNKCLEENIKVYYWTKDMEQMLKEADVVILHWWHHPIMAKFLHEFPKIPMRLILWVHVSGCNYPMLSFKFVDRVNAAFFTTKYTFDNPYWTKEQRNIVMQKAHLVYGMGEQLNNTQKDIIDLKTKTRINIGYIGTINNSKMHPMFLKYCKEVISEIPNAYFTIVGGDEYEVQIFRKKVKEMNMEGQIKLTGYVTNVEDYFKEFDIFGYLLNPYHYGASENVILEALSFGIPVIALKQSAEKYLLRHMYSGILVENTREYVEAIKYLIDNKKEIERLTQNAHREIDTEFSMENNINRMRKGIEKVIKQSKGIYDFRDIFGEKPSDWFLSCLGEDRGIFEQSLLEEKSDILKECKPIFKEKSKSSVNHFLSYFPKDSKLRFWKEKISEYNR